MNTLYEYNIFSVSDLLLKTTCITQIFFFLFIKIADETI